MYESAPEIVSLLMQDAPMTITKRMRYEVMQRDGFACRYCGRPASVAELHVDHVIPKSLGGPDSLENLVAACHDCNIGKGSTLPDSATQAVITSGDKVWREAMSVAATEEFSNVGEAQEAIEAFDERWCRWGAHGEPLERAFDWPSSIRALLARGLPLDLLLDSVDVAMHAGKVADANVWRYFCGVAWNRTHKLEERAKQLLEEAGGGGVGKDEGLRESVEDSG